MHLEGDMILIAIRIVVAIELFFFSRFFFSFMKESIEIRTGSYREVTDPIIELDDEDKQEAHVNTITDQG